VRMHTCSVLMKTSSEEGEKIQLTVLWLRHMGVAQTCS
jgi:hypothetical protein